MSSDNDRERLVAEIDSDLKARVKADPRPIREVVEKSLEREFATGETAAVERRIEEKRTRINQLEKERNERERELAAEKDELTRLERQLEAYESSQDAELQEAIETLDDLRADVEPTNDAVKTQAKNVGMTPEELINEYERRTN